MLLLIASASYSQQPGDDEIDKARSYLKDRGEIILKFRVPDGYSVNDFSKLLSLDNLKGDTVIAYANKVQFGEFLNLKIAFRVMDPPSLRLVRLKTLNKSLSTAELHYPSYSEYVDTMQKFVTEYPDLCRLVELGESVNGHKILALKISDNPGSDENEPGFFYTSSIHGDEVTGYILTLELIHYLLVNYNTDTLVKKLVDHIEIWINPLSNPDGTYYSSDTSVYGATRFNANSVDLNRNFPDPAEGDHPDGNIWQPETQVMMDFLKNHRIILAANLHGGSEVVNYPWDTWSRLHADNDWYINISREYADTVHAHSPEGYMTDLENGISDGYQWYRVTGGRQDYNNYFMRGREVTIELSEIKMPDESELPQYWNSNRKSMLDYMEEVLYGVSGTVTDSVTGQPLVSNITVIDHDKDNSSVYSSATDGSYYRLIAEGNYIFSYTSPGYYEKRLIVDVTDDRHITRNVKLVPLEGASFRFYPNPFKNDLNINIPEAGKELILGIYDLAGRRVREIQQFISTAGQVNISVSGLNLGAYIIKFTYGNTSGQQIVIKPGL